MSSNNLEKGVVIQGSIRFKNDLSLDCKVDGEIISENGDLVLNKHSDVKGSIKTGQVTIHGKIEGSVEADTCRLQGTADINGDLAYKSLGMEPGAKMVGSTKILS